VCVCLSAFSRCVLVPLFTNCSLTTSERRPSVEGAMHVTLKHSYITHPHLTTLDWTLHCVLS